MNGFVEGWEELKTVCIVLVGVAYRAVVWAPRGQVVGLSPRSLLGEG